MIDTYLSREGYEKFHRELQELKALKQALSREIGEAMAQGDLRENAGYTAAKERQAGVLRRISLLESRLRTARLIDEVNIPQGEIRIGATITLQEVACRETLVYTLVSAEEADPTEGKISVLSPLAQGLLGHKAGETVPVTLPSGTQTFQVIKIER